MIVIGASAGGVEALIQLCRHFPENFPASIFIVLHTSPNSPGHLPQILQRYSNLPALYPNNDEQIEPGKIYIAPPNRHLLVMSGYVQLSSGPKENLLRPAADILFRTAAHVYGQRVVGVVLTGTRNDGTSGLQAIKHYGGIAIVQDPDEALFQSMPRNALQNLEVDFVLGIDEIASTLIGLTGGVQETVQRDGPMSDEVNSYQSRKSLTVV